MTFQTMLKAGVCASAVSGLFVSCTLAAREAEPLRLAPSSKWNLHEAEDSCRLLRTFGEGNDKVAFYIERFEPGDEFSMLVAGRPFRSISSRSYAMVRFGDAQPPTSVDFLPGSLPEFEPALIFSSTWFGSQRIDGKETSKASPDGGIISGDFSPEAEAAITYISVNRAGFKDVILETGSMGAPMAAMRKCTEGLLTAWGIDVEKHRNLAVRARPLESPQNWMRSADYPDDMLSKGYQGIVNFRMSIDANGSPAECHIQNSTQPQEFDQAVCASMMRNARFEPARTKEGEQIASYWRETVRFVIP
jgi:TonB family protein